MKPLTQRERRVLALGILVAAVAMVWLFVLYPLIGGFLDRASERRELTAAYVRNERLVTSLPALRAMADAQRKSASRFFVGAPSEALAAEALKERIQRVAADEGVSLKAIVDLQPDAPPGTIKLRADMTLTLTQLYETLRRLETEDAYVVIDYISINADRAAAEGRLAPIDVRVEFSTDWRPVRGQP